MKKPLLAFSLTCLAAGSAAHAQNAMPGRPTGQPSLFGRPQAAKTDPDVTPTSVVPEPVEIDKLKPATIVLPDEAIEPYLLTRDNGPFMVMAKAFKGPEAERYALALVLELRRDYGLPAYILRMKDFPMKTVMRNVPPLTPPYIRKPNLAEPERTRSTDEATVLVGDEKTLDDSVKLLARVKKIKPKCLNEMPTPFYWKVKKGLQTAQRTTNPFVPTQELFPGRRRDTLVTQMNGGPHSIYNCPGRFTLQIAEFSGRQSFETKTKESRFFDNASLKDSPLMTAMDDAEKLATKLAKDPEILKTGFQPYVYHDRSSSKVMIGSFQNPADPAAPKLRDQLLLSSVVMSDKKRVGMMIAPSPALTDLEDPSLPIKP